MPVRSAPKWASRWCRCCRSAWNMRRKRSVEGAVRAVEEAHHHHQQGVDDRQAEREDRHQDRDRRRRLDRRVEVEPPRRKPRVSEPESPMKTRAGSQLWRRKPRQAPAIAAISTTLPGLRWMSA